MIAVSAFCNARSKTDEFVVKSPSGNIEAEIHRDKDKLTYSVRSGGRIMIDRGDMGIVVDNKNYANALFDAEKVEIRTFNTTYQVLGIKSTARNHYNGASIPMTTPGVGSWTLGVRVYDDGFAFRYQVPGTGLRTVQGEITSFVLPGESVIWYFERKNAWKLKSYAGEWLKAPIDKMPTVSGKLGPVQGLPLVAELPEGGYMLLSDAACWNYSSLRGKAVGNNTFKASLADKSFEVDGNVITPWRVVLCAPDLNALVNSTIISNLAPPPDPNLYGDTDYIRPGRCVWRWWSSGTGNPQEEEEYINYAEKLGFEYTIIDDGWKDWPNAWEEVTRLCSYARQKGVGVFLWKHSKDINDPADAWANMRTFLDKVVKAGAVGIKTDFMNSDGKAAIDFEIALLKLAAERKLMVNFHGCHKSTGEARTFPNEVTREGIRGLELNKMKEGPITASHNAALPFTRFVVGHGDYTPFTVTAERMGPTTLAHQLATVICFTSPLQVIAENPAELLVPEHKELTGVLKEIPSVWDETRVLPGSRIGELTVMARRKGKTWFIAGLNGMGEQIYSLDLSFLGKKTFLATIVQDHPDASDKVTLQTRNVNPAAKQNMVMSKGGGFVYLLKEQ
ncbi:hypothetical protein BVX97_04370 [bacterium E08(2017)]|nr:hypothetical protein BVX97_04370 [bacterium E08(2017)]